MHYPCAACREPLERALEGPAAACEHCGAPQALRPDAGEDGKLGGRMREGPARGRVRAKTGFIAGTSGLSGTLQTLGGRRMAFAILVAYPSIDGLNTHCWKPMQDEICELLVASDGG